MPGSRFHFKGLEQKQAFFDYIHGQFVVLVVQGVGQKMGDPFLTQPGNQLVDILAQRHDLAELHLGDMQRHHMDLTAVSGNEW